MKKQYNREVKAGLNRTGKLKPEVVIERDLQHLPGAVRKYLDYVGVIGSPRVINFNMKAKGVIRNSPDYWMKLKSEQYNFYDEPSRFFYITAKRMGIPAVGLHAYKNRTAIMVIKLAGLFKVVDARGPEMDQAETVTLFNDMCVMAPATLIDQGIIWEDIDALTVRARFTNADITISATLVFNEQHQLVNFISDDRYETIDGKTFNNYPWETPLSDYHDFNGFMLASKGDLLFKRPEGDFCYGKFELCDVQYNVQ